VSGESDIHFKTAVSFWRSLEDRSASKQTMDRNGYQVSDQLYSACTLSSDSFIPGAK